MKKSVKKIVSLGLCAALAAGGVATTVYALNEGEKTSGETEQSEQEASANEGQPGSSRGQESEKDETVYIFAGPDGAVQKILVSDWLSNPSGSQTLNDKTELTNVENVRGDEGYTMGSDGAFVWDAQGRDIYYQGNTEKELPVGLSVTYKLNGETVSPAELAGKSGRVTIRFDYTARQYEEVEIEGKKETIYVPFAMVTGVVLDNDIFTNVGVTNGKLINDGSRTVVVGAALPGLQEDLAISEDQFEIPDYLEISADAENFELGMTVTLASNELWNGIDTDQFGDMDGLSGSMEELADAMEQLTDGSSRLYDGLSELFEKSGELADGVEQLATGAEALKNGGEELDAGAAALQSGASELQEGLQTIAANNDSLNGGARQVFETLLSTAGTQLAAAGVEVPPLTVEGYADTLDAVIASLDADAVHEKALAAVTEAVEQQRSYIREQVTAAVREQVAAQVTAAVREQAHAQVTQAVRDTVEEQVVASVLQMDRASFQAAVESGAIDDTVQAGIEAAVGQQMQSDQILLAIQANTEEQMASETAQAAIAANTDAQMQSETVQATIDSNTEAQVQKAITENMESEEVQAQIAAAAEGVKAVAALKASLDDYNTFYMGLQTYTAGVSAAASGAGELKKGADELKDGTGQLSQGASELYDGVSELQNGIPALTDGVTQLRDGAGQLSDGIKEMDEKGIQKLIDAVDGDLERLITRLDAVGDVSRRYTNFSGVDEGTDGQVRFIYRTGSIE